MTTWARIEDGHVRETVPFDPEGRFPADWLWIECPDDTQQGAAYDDKTGVFKNPAASPPAPPVPPDYRTTMSAVRFKAQFTLPEQVKIQFARNYVAPDPTNVADQKLQAKVALDVLFGTLADLVALGTEIDVADPSVQAGLDFLAATTIITPARAAEIKKGILQ